MADANFALLDKRGKKYVIVAGRKFSSIGVIWTLEQKGILKLIKIANFNLDGIVGR